MHAGSRLCGNLMSPTTKRLESGLCSSSSLLPPRVVQQYDDNHTSTLFAGDDETIPAVRAIGHRLVYRFEQARALPESQSSPDRLGFASCGGRWLLLNTALVFLTFARTDLCYSRAPARPRILHRAIYRARDHLFPGGPAAAALGAGLGWVPAGCGAETSARSGRSPAEEATREAHYCSHRHHTHACCQAHILSDDRRAMGAQKRIARDSAATGEPLPAPYRGLFAGSCCLSYCASVADCFISRADTAVRLANHRRAGKRAGVTAHPSRKTSHTRMQR